MMWIFRVLPMQAIIGAIAMFGSLASAVPSTAAEPERPLVIIPGFAGSQLSTNGKVIWGGRDLFGNLDNLAIPNGPVDPSPKADATELLHLKILLFEVQPYDPLIQFLETALGYKLGETLFLFPYDWRQDAFTSASDFDRVVRERIPQLAPPQKFDIIAHSFGGLVARAYLAKFDDQVARRQVVNLICMGTPFFGSMRAIEALQHPLGSSTYDQIAAGLLGAGQEKTRRALLTFPSFYEMLPTHKLCCIRGKRAWIGTGNNVPIDALDAQEWENFGGLDRDNLKRALAAAADLATLAKADPPQYLKETLIATGNIETDQDAFFDGPIMSDSNLGSSDFDRAENGDGTVLEWSATRGDSTRNTAPSFASHMKIFDDDAVRAVLKSRLRPDMIAPQIQVKAEPRTIRSLTGTIFSNVKAFTLDLQSPVMPRGGALTALIKIKLDQNEVSANDEAARMLDIRIGIDRFDGEEVTLSHSDWKEGAISAKFVAEAFPGDQAVLTYQATIVVPDETGVGRLRAISSNGRLDESALFLVSD